MMTEAELILEIQAHKSRIVQLEQSLHQMQWAKQEIEREKNYNAYHSKKEQMRTNGEILKKYLSYGNYVKVTGSRSRSKFRKIVKTGPYDFSGQHLEVLKNVVKEELPMITSHGYSKITEVFHEEKWIKVKDYLSIFEAK